MKKIIFLFALILATSLSGVYAQGPLMDDAGIKSFHLQELFIRFTINIIAVFLLVRVIYFTRHQNKDFLLTYILFNCINFLICFMLSGANLGVGFAFGLFAIFSIMRYRTVTLPVKEMGYLFLCVALGLLNALAPVEESYMILISANAFILLLAFFLDRTTSITHSNDESKQIEKNTRKIEKLKAQMHNLAIQQMQHLPTTETSGVTASTPTAPANAQDIIYERIDLIKSESRKEMIEDLRNRTGLPIYRIEIIKIDFMRDTAEVRAHFYGDKGIDDDNPEAIPELV